MNNSKVFQKYFFWLIRDEEFMSKFAKLIDPSDFTKQPQSWLATQALRYFEEMDVPLPEDAMLMNLVKVQETKDFKHVDVLDLWEEAPEPAADMRRFLFGYAETYFKGRRAEDVVGEFATQLEAGNILEAIDHLQGRMDTLTLPLDDQWEGVDIFSDFNATFDLLASTVVDDGRSISTGMFMVDKYLDGGARPGELLVALAPPGRGKSQFLVNVAREGWKQRKNVIYVTNEMSEERVFRRFCAGLVGINANDVFRQREKVFAKIQQYQAKYGWHAHFHIKRFGDGEATTRDISNYIRDIQKQEGWETDLIVLDYADNLKPPDSSIRELRTQQRDIYRKVRNLAIEHDVPVWTASQANREAFNKPTFGINTVADSWDKVKIADYVVAVCQTEDEKAANTARLHMAKTRNEVDGANVLVSVNFAESVFMEMR